MFCNPLALHFAYAFILSTAQPTQSRLSKAGALYTPQDDCQDVRSADGRSLLQSLSVNRGGRSEYDKDHAGKQLGLLLRPPDGWTSSLTLNMSRKKFGLLLRPPDGWTSALTLNMSRHINIWRVCLCVFGLFACCSVVQENATTQVQGKDDDNKREKLWDITKFILSYGVWMHHGGFDTLQTSPTDVVELGIYYRGWMMATFFFISGLVTHAHALPTYQSVKKCFRDLVLGNVLVAALECAIFSDGWQARAGIVAVCLHAWFLPALAVNRLVIQPCASVIRTCCGQVGGAILCIFLSLAIPYVAKVSVEDSDNLFFPACHALGPEMCPNIRWRLLEAWFPFVVGLFIDPQWLAVILRAYPMVTGLFVLAAFITLAGVNQFLMISAKDLFVADEQWYRTSGEFARFVVNACIKLGCSMLFLGILSLAPTGNAIMTGLARLGQRTLYSYQVNVFLFLSLGMGPEGMMQWIHAPTCQGSQCWTPHVLAAAHVTTLFAVIAATSPLTEKCLSWAISPQWILDVIACVIPQNLMDMRAN